MKGSKIIIGIAGAMLVAGITKTAQYFPNLIDILSASNLLVSAVVAYFVGKDA